jgi:hypothetical protein
MKRAESVAVCEEDRELIRATKRRGGAVRVDKVNSEHVEINESTDEPLVDEPVARDTPKRINAASRVDEENSERVEVESFVETVYEPVDLCSESDEDVLDSPLGRKSMIPTRTRQIMQSPLIKKFGAAQRYNIPYSFLRSGSLLHHD